jgi:ubiquinone/menaquinone biosynthesis C-methylase UbiE
MGRVGALLYDRLGAASEAAGMREERRRLLGRATGEVLEIGAGTGLNLLLYPTAVTRVVAVEPDRHMARRLRRKAQEAPMPVEIVSAPAEALALPTGSFDTVVGTLVLCTVHDPAVVLAEVARLLRPGGRYLFLEHVRAHDARLARWQDRLAPLWGVIGGGCHPNRATLASLRASPLTVAEVHEGRIPKAAPLVRPMITGVAERQENPAADLAER